MIARVDSSSPRPSPSPSPSADEKALNEGVAALIIQEGISQLQKSDKDLKKMMHKMKSDDDDDDD